ncbi:MAG: hypothetical protein F2947_06615 [Actinobacteria bacterium]|jgi:hypothetical protein|uniref:Unannotated protein n=1 Tax=freshwater metagenome TaxID=449393 RepID=A0A6J6JQR2_9ZZZZ|nr:hypothetical protein [Actinomycetota bacterium]MSW32689.1 hypothetical protein [Actinomycetota bacterium]MSY25680.1 hypothetical protein [Actinomycetota bacterium]MSZ53057.1 hypothetical protein [Actinomycetota bacterium]MTA44976.1 hypothetical protein [Actinomycetota bacterium]
MVLVIAALLLAVLLVIALLANRRTGDFSAARTTGRSTDVRLPVGADAALWSIVEVVPDPRNHLALTRDLTGEVRISGTLLDPAVRASTLVPPPRPAPAGGSSVRILTAAEIEREDAAAAAAAARLNRAS